MASEGSVFLGHHGILLQRKVREIRKFPSRGWSIGQGKEGGGEERKICLPVVIVLLGNSICGQTEFLIGAFCMAIIS